MHDGRDIADTPIELKSGETLSNVQILVTNHVTSVAGRLADEKGQPLTDAHDPGLRGRSRAVGRTFPGVRAVRPNQQGEWQVKGLPDGAYLAIALEYVEDGLWNDPAFLESLRRDAQALTITSAQRRKPWH